MFQLLIFQQKTMQNYLLNEVFKRSVYGSFGTHAKWLQKIHKMQMTS